MRTAFKIILAVLSLIPLFFAVTGLMGGASAMNGGDAVTANLDNQFRYLSAYYLSLFFLIWWVLGDIDNRGGVLRLLVLAIFLGGLARLYSTMTLGTPTPDLVAGMALELGAPVLVVWQHYIAKDITKTPSPIIP